jgi:hypothetical protein
MGVRSLRSRLSPLGNMLSRGDGGRLDRAAARLRRPLDRRYMAASGALDALRGIGAQIDGRDGGPRVLMLALRSWPEHNAIEATIAHALRLRGAQVAVVTCGGGMPVCEQGWARRAWPRPCDRCGWYTDEWGETLGMRRYRLADQLPWGGDSRRAPAAPPPGHEDRAAHLAAYSVPWLLRVADAGRVPEGEDAARDFAVTVDGLERAFTAILDDFAPDIVFAVNGRMAAERTMRELVLARGLRAPTYEISPRGGALVFSQDAPAPAYDLDEAWAQVGGRELSEPQAAAVADLLTGRAEGRGAHERYFDRTEEDRDTLRRELDIPHDARVVSLFSNLVWDSATLFNEVAYPSMADWIAGAVSATAELDDTLLVVRVHPAETRWGTRERALDGVLERLGTLPRHVRWIPPEQPLSSYALVDLSDVVLTYASTVGLEAACRGKPVAVAARTHYRGRGFTMDLASHADMRAAVRAPVTMTSERRALAERYAFAFFFRAMIPFPALTWWRGRVQSMPQAADLERGRDRYLDWICDRLLDGGSFALGDDLALPDGAGRDAVATG